MDRRLVGVAVVVAAFTAVMIIPVLSGLRLPGTAEPVALPAPPAVGDCVAALPAGATTAGLEQPVPMEQVQLGSCRGAIAGEVVGFWPDEQALAQAPRSRRAGPCYPPLAQYASLTLDATSHGAAEPWLVEPVSWRPTLAFQAYLITPTDLERRAGRTWAACVVGPAGGQQYRGSLAGAFGIGALPIGFGSCWTTASTGLLAGPWGVRASAHGAAAGDGLDRARRVGRGSRHRLLLPAGGGPGDADRRSGAGRPADLRRRPARPHRPRLGRKPFHPRLFRDGGAGTGARRAGHRRR
jgi:hypothetical protein